MGCTSSKVDEEEAVARCRNRKRYIREAVQHRHAFAAAHAEYLVSLRNAGAAIRQYGEGEGSKETQMPPSPKPQVGVQPPPPPPPPEVPSYATLLPPPPPPKSPSPTRAPATPISRAVSMPALGAASSELSSMMSPPNEEGKDEFLMAQVTPPHMDSSQDPSSASPLPGFDYLGVSQGAQPNYEVTEDSASDVSEVEGRRKGKQERGTRIIREEEVESEAVEENSEASSAARTEEKQEMRSEEKREKKDTHEKKAMDEDKQLLEILQQIDDFFLEASNSGNDVGKILQASKVHYHSNYAEEPAGVVDHSKKVLRVMSWTRNAKSSLGNEDFVSIFEREERETHASTLDKILAWEKKLYDEVKAGEAIRIELQRKTSHLKNMKNKKGTEAFKKTHATFKSLQTKYLVEFEAIDSASSEIEKLRDDHLYGQLVGLVKGQSAMWKTMLACHQRQCKLVENEAALYILKAPLKTNEYQRKNTEQLEKELQCWQERLHRMTVMQREYIESLHGWLKLNILQIESEMKDKTSSPDKTAPPPIHYLCEAWLKALEKLSCEEPLKALESFAESIKKLVDKQVEELKQRKKYEMVNRELEKKRQSVQNLERKFTAKHMDELTEAPAGAETASTESATLQERKQQMAILSRKMEEEKERYEKLCKESHNLTIRSLSNSLPRVVKAITIFAQSCSDIYANLVAFVETGKHSTHARIPK